MMVQLWPGIPPEVLCDMYLNSCLNEGLNLLIRHHMAKGHRIDGWIRNGCVDLEMLHVRIKQLIKILCMERILVPNDGNYPTELPHVV